MKTGTFKSTTAIAVMLSLAAPMPALAQGKRAEIDLGTMTAAEISQVVSKCKKRADRRDKKISAGEEPQEKRGQMAKFCAAYGSGSFDDLLPEDLRSAAILGADNALAAEAESVDVGAGAELEAEANVETEANQGGSAETTADVDAAVETEADAAAAPDSQASAAEANSAGAAAEGDPEASGSAPQAVAETEPTAQAEAEAEADAEVETEAEADPQTDTAEADTPEVQKMDSQAQADAVAAANDAPAAAAAASGETDGEAEVIEETVTEETSRSSDEEFETTVDEAAAPAPQAAPAPATADDDDGLSDIQRAALLGLGALAVGKLLNSGEKVVSNSGDRAVVEQDGQYRVLKNDDALLRQPGSDVTTYRFKDGSTRTVVVRGNGVEVETIRAADGRVLRRTRTLEDGRTVVLFDDTQKAEEVVVNELPQTNTDTGENIRYRNVDADELAAALAAQDNKAAMRRFSLSQVRGIDAVRRLVPEINVDSINFETGSAVIRAEEAQELAALGNALRSLIDQNPSEVFLIEGHTDAVGSASYNLALSDRRAETVALALTEYFDVPPENLVIQGYGEADLAVQTSTAERANRRAAVRRITPLLQSKR